MKVIVGSTNSAKIEAVSKAFLRMFKEAEVDVTGIKVDSGVASQPRGMEDTIQGAINRARGALEEVAGADLGVGLEAGLFEINGDWFTGGIVAIIAPNKEPSIGISTMIKVHKDIMISVDNGKDLGTAINEYFQVTNAQHQGGYFGIMTNQRLTRESVFRDACIAALAGMGRENDFSRN